MSLLQTPEGIAKGLAEYGALGVLILALIWLLQLVLTKLPALIENNTKAITELTAALKGTIVSCPMTSDPVMGAWLRTWAEHSSEALHRRNAEGQAERQ